ncbi:MAG: hypothetical protein STHCBS139747_001718 [Sporothrix thermara]
MPSVAPQEAPDNGIRSSDSPLHGLSILSKKRRWEDGSRSSTTTNASNDVVTIFVHGSEHDASHMTAPASTYTLNNNNNNNNNSEFSPLQRKLLPVGTKRLCLGNMSGKTDSWAAPLSLSAASPSSKSVREPGPHNHQQAQHGHPPPHPSITAPCHICHRKPRRKCDLDSLAFCEGCGERTCFVCLRECLGWAENEGLGGETATTPTADHGEQPQPWSTTSHGHRRTVCSQCCVERGEDGDVVCLGCIAVVGA